MNLVFFENDNYSEALNGQNRLLINALLSMLSVKPQ